MRYTVFMLQEAEYDLESIFSYILGSGNPSAAKDMIRLIRKACESLSQSSTTSADGSEVR